MATTDWELAGSLQSNAPHTFNAIQKLVVAMAKVAKHQGKKSLFGRDKGLAAYKDFEVKLHDTILALVLDNVVKRNSPPALVVEKVCNAIYHFAQAFPNWQDAYSYAAEYFVDNAAIAESRIGDLMGFSSASHSTQEHDLSNPGKADDELLYRATLYASIRCKIHVQEMSELPDKKNDFGAP